MNDACVDATMIEKKKKLPFRCKSRFSVIDVQVLGIHMNNIIDLSLLFTRVVDAN